MGAARASARASGRAMRHQSHERVEKQSEGRCGGRRRRWNDAPRRVQGRMKGDRRKGERGGVETRARANEDEGEGEYSDRDRARGRGKGGDKIKSVVNSDGDGASVREAFLDGAEVFALTAAVGVKARAAYVERRNVAMASRAGVVTPPRGGISTFGDIPLYAAVVAGTLLRRLGKSGDESKAGALRGVPSSVSARIAMLEQANDSVVEVSRRTARDVSRVGTRLRLTRRELSPPLRKVQAETKENAQILAAVAQKLETLEAELLNGQSTMSGLHTVSSKQFEVLSKAISDLKQSQIELEARLTGVKLDAGGVKFEDQLVRDQETVARDAAKAPLKLKSKSIDSLTSVDDASVLNGASSTKISGARADDDDDDDADENFVRYPRRV